MATPGWVRLHGLRGITEVFIATSGPAGEVPIGFPYPLGKHGHLGPSREGWGIRCQDERVSTGLLIPPRRVVPLGSCHLFRHERIQGPHSLCKWDSVAAPNRVWWHYSTGKNGILADAKTLRKQAQSFCIDAGPLDISSGFKHCSCRSSQYVLGLFASSHRYAIAFSRRLKRNHVICSF